jgi:Ca2+-binding RTX toxin-like protein
MDLNDVEKVSVDALGGTDTITVNDLSGTDVTEVSINLAGTLSGTAGDGQVDNVLTNATNGNDTIGIVGASTSLTVVGLPALVSVTNAKGGLDGLTVQGLAGDDSISAATLPAGIMKLTLDGGAGNDSILGSGGADRLIGGDGDDFVDGNRGDDVALLGAGNDLFQWDPGDGSDVVEGQAGLDTLLFNGANISENINISANGGRARFFRDVASVTMDLNDVEHINFNALGGTDNIVVNDMTGTDVKQVSVNLASTPGGSGGDGQVDTIVINATSGDDVISVANNNGIIAVSGLAAQITILNFEATDRLVINGLAGDDVIEASGLDGMLFTANGGDGDDILIGSKGNDVLNGGAGDDVLLGGPGVDVLDGGPGDNIVIQSLIAGAGGLGI